MSGDLIPRVEREYDRETGAIGLLRNGRLDQAALQRLVQTLRECPPASDGPIDGRLVRLLWWMPWIAEWQGQRLEREGKDAKEIRQAGDAIFRELERILGVA